MIAETLRRMSSVCAAWVGLRSHESAAVRSAAKPAANVVTKVTPMTSPIVERVVRPGSRTALRAATLLGGSVPSSRLAVATRRGTTSRAPTSRPVPESIAPSALARKPAAPPDSPRPAAAASTTAPDPMSMAVTSRRSRLARGVSGAGTEAPDNACAGVARSTAREPTQAAPAAASVDDDRGRRREHREQRVVPSGRRPTPTSTARVRSPARTPSSTPTTTPTRATAVVPRTTARRSDTASAPSSRSSAICRSRPAITVSTPLTMTTAET